MNAHRQATARTAVEGQLYRSIRHISSRPFTQSQVQLPRVLVPIFCVVFARRHFPPIPLLFTPLQLLGLRRLFCKYLFVPPSSPLRGLNVAK